MQVEAREAVRALPWSPEHLAAIVESSDDAIIGKTLDGTIISWNPGAERIYGYRDEEVIGRPISILVPPDHSDELPPIFERLRRGERIDHYRTVRVHKDGKRITVSVTISPVRDEQGQIVGASAVAGDITAQPETIQEAILLRAEFLSIAAPQPPPPPPDVFAPPQPAERRPGLPGIDLQARPGGIAP